MHMYMYKCVHECVCARVRVQVHLLTCAFIDPEEGSWLALG